MTFTTDTEEASFLRWRLAMIWLVLRFFRRSSKAWKRNSEPVAHPAGARSTVTDGLAPLVLRKVNLMLIKEIDRFTRT